MQNTAEEKNTLEALNWEIGEAEKRRDATFLDGVLADDLIFRRANGVIVNKEQYMADLMVPFNTYERLDSRLIEVTLHEDTAIVSLLVNAKGIRRNTEGQDVEFEGLFRNTRIFLKPQAGENWRCAVWFNTKPEQMVVNLGIYRVDERPEGVGYDAALAEKSHRRRSVALHSVFDGSSAAQVLDWGQTDDAEPHEFVEALVAAFIVAGAEAVVEHAVVPGIKALVQKLRERNVTKERAQAVGGLCAQLAAKREANEINDFHITLPDSTRIHYAPPDPGAQITIKFADGTLDSILLGS